MNITRRHMLAGAAALGALPFAAQAQGAFDLDAARRRVAGLKPQGYPTQPIEMVVVYPAGGGMDVTGRVVQRYFEKITQERSFVNNRTGGAGLVGHTWIATQAPSDGHALGIVANLIFSDARRSQGRWKWDDLDHIAALNAEPLNLVVNAEGPFKDSGFRGVIEAARARPNTVRFTVVPGGYYEWMIGQIEQASGARFLKVPFQGGGPGITALLGNNVDIGLGFFAEIRAHIQANRLVPVAVSDRQRSTFLPNAPTVNEVLNVNDINWGVARWIAVPKAVPAARKAWLAAAFQEAVRDPGLVEEFRNLGALPNPALNTPQAVNAEVARMARNEEEFLIRTGRLQRAG